MKRLSNDDITHIRQQANIVDVVSNYIPLIQAGNNYKAICPFHDDTNPSLSVNVQKQIYKCFACGQGGNVFTFVRDYESISFIEAVVKVGEMVGFDFSDYTFETYKPKIDDQLARLYHLMNEAQSYIEFTLNNTKDEMVKNFLKQRGLTPEIIKVFKIGYVDSNFPLADYLFKKGFRQEELELVNLAGMRNDGSLYDIFNSRLLYPITNQTNQVVAYTGRALIEEGAKYINSATSLVFQKAEILYNYPMANMREYRDQSLVLCEGVMDVIAFYQSGHRKVVATLGTALSDQQIHLIKKLNCPIVLAYDPDEAGQNASYQIGTQLRNHRLQVLVYNNQTELDPDEVLHQQSKEALYDMISHPLVWMEFVIIKATQLYSLNSYNARKQVIEFCLVHLQDEDPLAQGYFIKQLSELTQFDAEEIRAQLLPKTPTRVVKKVATAITTLEILQSEKEVLAHILDGKNFAQQFRVELGYLINQNANDLALLMLNLYKDHDTINVADCLNMNLNPTQQSLLIEISEDPLYQYPKSENQLKELIYTVRVVDIEKLLKENQKQIQSVSNPQEKIGLLKEKIELTKKQDELKREGFNGKI